jgi:hypothetical protein
MALPVFGEAGRKGPEEGIGSITWRYCRAEVKAGRAADKEKAKVPG